jgi:hypothetical protein
MAIHIFDRFHRVSNPEEKTYPGLGIGLYIAREIIQRHNGTLTVESEKLSDTSSKAPASAILNWPATTDSTPLLVSVPECSKSLSPSWMVFSLNTYPISKS